MRLLWSLGLIVSLTVGPLAFAEAGPGQPAPDSFLAKGSITEVQAQEKMIRVKIEGGLELTFHITEKTEITEGMPSGPSSALKPGDFVEIAYDYNENFEKIARSITRLAPEASH